MIPSDIGLPPRFSSFRKGQEDIVIAAAACEKRFLLLNAPPGTGKSAIVIGAANLIGGRALVLTGTKQLQSQYMGDFETIGMRDIRGQNNYRCIALDAQGELFGLGRQGASCDEGPCHLGADCSLKKRGCTYYDAVRKAMAARLVITNYRYWMTLNRYSEPDVLGKFDTLILDEAHNAPDELAEFCAIELHREVVKTIIDMALPSLDEDSDTWVEWAREAIEICRRRYVDVRDQLTVVVSKAEKSKLLEEMRRITALGRSLKELANAHAWRRSDPSIPTIQMPGAVTDWVAEYTASGAQFSPVWAHQYAEEYLFRQIPRVILTSATLQRFVAPKLGIVPDAMEYREYASAFDVKRRPIISVPVTTVDRHMVEGQVRMWINKIDSILDLYLPLNIKGIIHARSYDRAQEIVRRSRHRNRMLTHGTRTAGATVDDFKHREGGWCLVSPSLQEGHDFPYDLCRYVIIAKVPFVDTRSRIMQARVKSDKQYQNYLTALALLQQSGRGMRAEDDWCVTYIVDDHFAAPDVGWFYRAACAKKLFPKWWRDAVRLLSRGEDIPALPVVNGGSRVHR